MQPLYIAAYHQSKFGKLMGMMVPEILKNAVTETCGVVKADLTRVRRLHRTALAARG